MSVCRLLCVTVATAIFAGGAQAQQWEANLRLVEIADSEFNLVVATARPGSASADYRGQPDPNLVYLGDGNLVFAYIGEQQTPAEEAIFTPPAYSFKVEDKPVVIYLIPKSKMRP